MTVDAGTETMIAITEEVEEIPGKDITILKNLIMIGKEIMATDQDDMIHAAENAQDPYLTTPSSKDVL